MSSAHADLDNTFRRKSRCHNIRLPSNSLPISPSLGLHCDPPSLSLHWGGRFEQWTSHMLSTWDANHTQVCLESCLLFSSWGRILWKKIFQSFYTKMILDVSNDYWVLPQREGTRWHFRLSADFGSSTVSAGISKTERQLSPTLLLWAQHSLPPNLQDRLGAWLIQQAKALGSTLSNHIHLRHRAVRIQLLKL